MNCAIAYARLVPFLLFAILLAKTETPKIWEELSGEKAFGHVQRLVDFGPRPAGSTAIEKSRDYIEDQLRRSGWQGTREVVRHDTPRGTLQFLNVVDQLSVQGT